jgi:Tfp pilus assembly protein PilN
MSVNQTKLRIRDVDAQTALLQDTVDRVEALKADIARLEPRVNILVRAQNSTDRWRGVLQAVSASLPDKTWVTSFQSKPSTKDKTEGFSMTGQTVTHDRIGRAMLKMNKSPFVKSVDLNFAAQRQQGSGVAFELGAELKPVEGASDAS